MLKEGGYNDSKLGCGDIFGYLKACKGGEYNSEKEI
jgi:hypothetical protein